MRTEQGFTLIEIMVAMVVLSVALFELGRMQLTALRTTSNANRVSQASSIAQDRIEQLMALAYDHEDLDDTTPVGQFTTYYPDPGDPPPQGYTVRWEVDTDNPEPNVKLVNVKVTRENASNRTFVLSLRKGMR